MTLASSPGGAPSSVQPRPLVLAIDRALISCDLTIERLISYLKLNPRRLFDVLGWLWRGRAYVKDQLNERAPMDVETLPVNKTLATFARAEAGAGRLVYLASTLDAALSNKIEKRLPFVAGGITGKDIRSLGDALARRFPQGFDYAAGSARDLEIWKHAGTAILVGASAHVQRRAAALVPISASIPAPSRFKNLLQSLRLHQWVKNLLVFAPIVLGGQLGDCPRCWRRRRRSSHWGSWRRRHTFSTTFSMWRTIAGIGPSASVPSPTGACLRRRQRRGPAWGWRQGSPSPPAFRGRPWECCWCTWS